MVKMLFNLFNKRKREIERLNTVIKELANKSEQFEKTARVMKAERDLLDRALTTANSTIIDLKKKIDYLEMRVDTTKNEVNSKYY
jgi:chromosome segregation ATPase